jgi:hypothetical protein
VQHEAGSFAPRFPIRTVRYEHSAHCVTIAAISQWSLHRLDVHECTWL